MAIQLVTHASGSRDLLASDHLQRTGLAVRLQEANVIAWLDTETAFTVARHLCRSLGIDPYLCYDRPDIADTG